MKKVSFSHIFNYNWLRWKRHLLGDRRSVGSYQKQKAIVRSILSERGKVLRQLHTQPVDRVHDISNKELFDKYIKPGKPVIIDGGALSWGCVGKWTPKWLVENYGDESITYMDSTPTDMKAGNFSVSKGKFKEIIEAINTEDRSKYIRFSPLLEDYPALIKEFDKRWLAKMRHFFSYGKKLQLFVGPKGSKTDLHCAVEFNFFTQVYGEKHWYLCPPSNDIALDPLNFGFAYFTSEFNPNQPDFEKFPLAADIDFYECTLKPGDILYNPSSWWHHVTNKSTSIGVGFRWFNMYRSIQLSLIQTLLTLSCYNPPIWKAIKLSRRDFGEMFSKKNLS
tara:strand:+ start:664 stop:1668 length:1005 start_codon:yes stop_codon:yes gene_type:complete